MCPDTQPRRARLTADFRGDRGETGGRVDPVTLEVITPVKPTFPQNWGKGPGAGTNRREPGPRRRSSGRGCGREPPGCKSGKLAGYSANWRNCRGATTATGREGQGPGEAEGVSPWPGWASTRPNPNPHHERHAYRDKPRKPANVAALTLMSIRGSLPASDRLHGARLGEREFSPSPPALMTMESRRLRRLRAGPAHGAAARR